MGALATACNRMSGTARKAARSRGAAQINAISKIGVQDMRAMMAVAGQELAPSIGNILVQKYQQAGIGRKSKGYKPTGTMLKAMRNPLITAKPNIIIVELRPGISYKNGNFYAAASTFKYGAVRQPLFKGKGTLVKDLPTGNMRQRKKAAGVLGQKLKLSIKKAYLANGKLVGLGKRSRSAFERAQDRSRKYAGQNGQAIDIGHGISIIAPLPPFMRLNGSDYKALQDEWVRRIADKMRRRGVEVRL